MSKTLKTGKVVDPQVEEFYRPCTSTGAFSESILQLRKTYKEHIAKPVPPTLRSRLDGPSLSWKIFRRLNQATEYADSFTKDCMVFSFEERLPESTGQRLFLVTHPQHLWLNHKPRRLHERCTYEVIREDAPCKLYFDLEFSKSINPHKDGIKMTEIFVKCIIASMFDKYNLRLATENILWLDSSTDQKYSCHLILQVPKIAFQNNIHAGYFVSLMLTNIKDRAERKSKSDGRWPSSEELQYLFVKNSDDRSVTFCDEGVYTRNRNFRLYLSTKFGKTTPLLVSENNKYNPVFKSPLHTDEVIFYDSLITYFRNGKTFERILSCDQDNAVKNMTRNNLPPRIKLGMSGVASSSPSPYPEVDEFVSMLVKDDHISGYIRKCSYLDNEELVVYEIGNYRYCGRIGRHHKSNNIMIIVDMKRKVYYQKCHDPECRQQGYKSTAKALPEYITSLYNVPDDFFETNCFTQLQNETEINPSPTDKTPTAPERVVPDEENQISNEFLEDLLLDSFPFTQLCSSTPSENTNTEKCHVNSEEVNNDNMEELFVADSSFADLSMDDLESEFASQTARIECRDPLNAENSSDNQGDILSENIDKKSSVEDMSSEDELMMAEAASAVEVSFKESMFSEETF